MQAAIQAIYELADQAAKPAWEWKPAEKDEALIERIRELSEADLRAAFKLRQKQARSEAIDAIWKRVFETIGVGTEGGPWPTLSRTSASRSSRRSCATRSSTARHASTA